MKISRQLVLCSFIAFMMSGCGGDDTVHHSSGSCSGTKVSCNDQCVSLDKLHWSECGKCAEGYVDKDGDAANGCESETASTSKADCKDGQTQCDDNCVELEKLHWSKCGKCADGYEDQDGDASNGCEAEKENDAPEQKECDEALVKCGEQCVDLKELNWSECGKCADGFEDKDGDASNGCEALVEEQPKPECEGEQVKCDDGCVDLVQMHWSSCGVCAENYEDKDGDASNGCETEKGEEPIICEGETVNCSGKCVNLAELHWSSCGVCSDGYSDKDGNAGNGCETEPKLPVGDCKSDSDCTGFAHVASTACDSGKCAVKSCDDGYADCDKDVITGCEVNGKTDYYHCGAKGLCAGAEEQGKKCELGEQCAEGTCKPVPQIVGCSDGTREGFLDLIRFNNLAACGGAWSIPGIHHNVPACGRKSGNNGENAAGTGCNLEDLCAEGWHVCLGRGDVMTRSDYGCNGIMDGVNEKEPVLFITRTSSTGNLNCDPDTVGVPLNMNDIFGCGNFGCYATGNDCDPLKLSSHNLCTALRDSCGCKKDASGNVTCTNTSGSCNGGGIGHSIDYFSELNGKPYQPAWDCGNDMSGWQEARDIVKSLPDQQGGVMCCKDQCEADADCGVGLICRYHVCVECIRKADGTYEGCPAGKTCSQQHTCI